MRRKISLMLVILILFQNASVLKAEVTTNNITLEVTDDKNIELNLKYEEVVHELKEEKIENECNEIIEEDYDLDHKSEIYKPEAEIQKETDKFTNEDSNIVIFKDNNLKKRLINLGIDTDGDGQISLQEAATVRSLNLSKRDVDPIITDISGLENFKNLNDIELSFNDIEDLNPISNLFNLTILNLNGNNIRNLESIKNLTNLKSLYLYNNNIEDISAIGNLVSLQELTLNNNYISDIEVLKNLVALRYINLEENYINDVTALSKLTLLTSLYLSGNNITDIKSLINLKNLRDLRLSNNNINDIYPIVVLKQKAINLTGLKLSGNPIIDDRNQYAVKVSQIQTSFDGKFDVYVIPATYIINKLETGYEVNVELNKDSLINFTSIILPDGTKITNDKASFNINPSNDLYFTVVDDENDEYKMDISKAFSIEIKDSNFKSALLTTGVDLNSDGEINIFEASKVTNLDLDNRNINSVEGIEYFSNLKKVSLSNNNLIYITPIKDLSNLEYIYLNNNNIENLNPLKNLERLYWLEIENNNITDISPIAILNKNYGKPSHMKLDGNNINNEYTPNGFHAKDLDFKVYWNTPEVWITPAVSNIKENEDGTYEVEVSLNKNSVINFTTIVLPTGQEVRKDKVVYNAKTLHELYFIIKDDKNNSYNYHAATDYYIDFEDERLQSALVYEKFTNEDGRYRRKYDYNNDDKISLAEAYYITDLNLNNGYNTREFTLGGIENLINLKKLNLSRCSIEDVKSLQSLTKIEELNLSYNNIRDISPLGKLKKIVNHEIKIDLTNYNNGNQFFNENTKDAYYFEELNFDGNEVWTIPATYTLDKVDGGYDVTININKNSGVNFTSIILPNNIEVNENTAKYYMQENEDAVFKIKDENGKLYEVYPYKDIVIDFPDENFKKFLINNMKIDLNRDDDITRYEAEKVTYMSAETSYNFSDISGIEHFKNLEVFNVSYYYEPLIINDIKPLSNLIKLQTLGLSNNNLKDINELEKLVNLKTLDLSNNEIENIDSLQNLINLENLNLANNKIIDISSLKNLTNLINVNLNKNKIKDISSLSNKIQLNYLRLRENNIGDSFKFVNTPALSYIDLSYNNISDGNVLNGLSDVSYVEINLKNNKIKDVVPLIKFSTDISLSGNPLYNSSTPGAVKLEAAQFYVCNGYEDGYGNHNCQWAEQEVWIIPKEQISHELIEDNKGKASVVLTFTSGIRAVAVEYDGKSYNVNDDKVTIPLIDGKNKFKVSTSTISWDNRIEYNVDFKLPLTDWKSHWANKEIKYAMDNKWINKSNIFRPEDAITRAEFVKIVNKAFEFTKRATNEGFHDVKQGDWWYNEVLIAVNAGYIDVKQDKFRPNDKISREEVAAIITSIKKNKDTNLDKISQYTDFKQVSSWARSSVEGAIEAGYMGKGSTSFRPTANITRAEAVVTLSRIK